MNIPVLELWYEALHTPIGIVVETNDPHRLQQALYQARAKAGDPDLDKLKIIISPTNPEGELQIAHKEIDDDGAG